MKKIAIAVIVCVMGIIGLNGCYYDNEESLYPDGANCDVSNVTFAQTIKPIVDSYCATAGCHVSGTGRVDLTTYSGVKGIADDGRFRQYVFVQKDMPPSSPLSTCDLARIDTWLNDGAPNN